MNKAQLQTSGLEKEVLFKTSRSSGKGGQHVNKVESRVQLMFDVEASQVLSEEQKVLVKRKLAAKISEEGLLLLSEESERSQLKNKALVIDKLFTLLAKCFVQPKKRKPTRLPKAVKEKRLKSKKIKGELKKNRREKF